MSEFTLHTLETAPLESRPFLQQAKNQLGFIPNLYAALAESPAILETNQVLTALFNKTAFTVTERQLILLSACLKAGEFLQVRDKFLALTAETEHNDCEMYEIKEI